MKQLIHGSLFAGIGGFDLGFERAGIKTVWQVEIDDRKRELLALHFPGVKQFADIRQCGAENLDQVHVISGGFPCQPFSTAGKRQATGDDRYLWPEMFRVIRSLRPQFVSIENVAGLAHEFEWVLEQVCNDLEAASYEVVPPIMVPLAAFGAWHRRDRVWILAYLKEGMGTAEQRQQQEKWASEFLGCHSISADNHCDGRERPQVHAGRREEGQRTADDSWGNWWDAEPGVGRMVHGLPAEVDECIAALGESVSPIATEWIGRRIVAASNL